MTICTQCKEDKAFQQFSGDSTVCRKCLGLEKRFGRVIVVEERECNNCEKTFVSRDGVKTCPKCKIRLKKAFG